MTTRRLLRDAPGIGYHPPPEPRDLCAAPELAVLAILDDVLETAVATLLAANPQLEHDPFEPDWETSEPASPRLYTADAVIYVAHALRCAIDRYRCAVRDAVTDATCSRPCGLDRSAAAAHRITLGEARHLEKPIDTRDST